MLDGYSSDFMSKRTAIQVSWQRVVLSRTSCVELKRQVAESRRLLQQSWHILAKSLAESRSAGGFRLRANAATNAAFAGKQQWYALHVGTAFRSTSGAATSSDRCTSRTPMPSSPRASRIARQGTRRARDPDAGDCVSDRVVGPARLGLCRHGIGATGGVAGILACPFASAPPERTRRHSGEA